MQRTYQLGLQGAINVPEAARVRLFELGKRRSFADGQFVLRQEEPADGFFAVVSGQAMIGRYAIDGSLTIYAVCGPGDLFGEQAFLTATPRLADAVADGPLEVVFFSGAVFRKSIVSDPKFAMLIMRSLAAQLKLVIERVDAERHMSVPDRLAQALLGMEETAGHPIACTHQQLADLLGVSRVTLGMALRQIEKTGAISGSYGKVRIVNRQMLQGKLAAGGGRVTAAVAA